MSGGTSKEEDGEDALALKADEGRGDRRNVQGELHTSEEPCDSEWGNPPGMMTRHLPPWERGRLGTETSQYRHDKTSTEIPVVVASEPGRAQTAFSQEEAGL